MENNGQPFNSVIERKWLAIKQTARSQAIMAITDLLNFETKSSV